MLSWFLFIRFVKEMAEWHAFLPMLWLPDMDCLYSLLKRYRLNFERITLGPYKKPPVQNMVRWNRYSRGFWRTLSCVALDLFPLLLGEFDTFDLRRTDHGL